MWKIPCDTWNKTMKSYLMEKNPIPTRQHKGQDINNDEKHTTTKKIHHLKKINGRFLFFMFLLSHKIIHWIVVTNEQIKIDILEQETKRKNVLKKLSNEFNNSEKKTKL